MKRSELQKMSKSDLVEMFADDIHNFDVVFQYDAKEGPGIINWYWNGGVSGNDDVEDFVKNIFPRLIMDEIEWAEANVRDPDEEDDIPF